MRWLFLILVLITVFSACTTTEYEPQSDFVEEPTSVNDEGDAAGETDDVVQGLDDVSDDLNDLNDLVD